jgi:hypothetical protein
MKQIIVSALGVAAFGATVLGARAAAATVCTWEGSGWKSVGTWNNFSTTEGNFSADYAIDDPPVTPANVTVSANTTGQVTVGFDSCVGQGEAYVPTCHQAFALCADETWLEGPVKCATVVGGVANESVTNSLDGGYWQNPGPTRLPDTTGYCPSGAGHQMVGGGVAVFEW